MDSRRAIVFALSLLQLGSVGLRAADDLEWDSPYGHATVFSDGPLHTTLSATTGTTSAPETTSLNYLEATSLPAVVDSAFSAGNAQAFALSSFALEEKSISGLYLSGHLEASADSAGLLAQSTLHLYILLTPASGAAITVSDLTNKAEAFGTDQSFFSLTLRASDSLGSASGSPLFVFGGNIPSPASASYAGASPHYLLELTAIASSGFAGKQDFAFTLDFAAVPEAQCGCLMLCGLGMLGLHRKRWAAANMV